MDNLARLIDEYLDLTDEVAARFDLNGFYREFTRGHAPQLAFMQDSSPFQHVMCARQSGKSWADDGILYGNARSNYRSTGLLIGIVGTGVRFNNWVPIWKQGVCEQQDVPDDWHNETNMLTTFDNGARVMFTGADDLSNIKKYLGNRLHNGVVIVDEAQDQKAEVLRYILRVLLPPMLTPTSRVILSGVLPDLPVGHFLDLAAFDEASKTGGKGQGYSHHAWARAQNIHTPEAMQKLYDDCKRHGISLDDPQILRDWYGKRAWDLRAGAYRYDPERNGYTPQTPEWLIDIHNSSEPKFREHKLHFCHAMREHPDDGARYGLMAAVPLPGVRYFAFALDPGAGDRASVQGWGWGDQFKGVQHVLDWSTPRGANLTTGQMFSVMGLAHQHYSAAAGQRGGVVSWRYDTTSKNTLDNLQKDYGIPVVQAAKKADLKGQVDRSNTLLVDGDAIVMFGSALEQDYRRAKWDQNARALGVYKWDRSWHPDPSEAGRYAQQDYIDNYQAPPPPPANAAEAHRAEVRAMLAEARAMQPQDEDA